MTIDDARQAYRIGLQRSRAARKRSGRHRFNWHPDAGVQRHFDGMSAVAERLVSYVTGRAWTSQGLEPDDPDAGDVEGGVAVRWTARRNGSLIVHEDEPDTLSCVLVVNETWPLRVVGWLPAVEAKQARWWRTDVRHPAFFVAQWALWPISGLEKT